MIMTLPEVPLCIVEVTGDVSSPARLVLFYYFTLKRSFLMFFSPQPF